jgi:MFS family permease
VTAALLALNARTFASLKKHRNYRLYFAGQVISLAGTWMQNVALAWFVVELTHSPVAVGALAFCRFAPFTVFGLIAGVLADRFDYRRLVMTTQTVSMLISIVLAVLALTGSATVWHAYVLAALLGTALVFDAPGRHALTFQMVGRDELPNAVALNTSLFNASRVTGPAVGGLIIAAWGVGVCFAVNAVSFLGILLALALMRPREFFPVDRGDERPRVFAGIREGLAYVRRSPQVRLVLAIVAVISTVGFNFHVVLPVLASETLETGAEVYGVLAAAFGAGAVLGALLSASLARASWKALLGGTAGFSLGLIGLAPQQTPLLAGVLLFVTGVFFTLWTSNSNSILQMTAPDHLRGRVVSIWLFAFAGLTPFGGLVAGWLADVGGTELALTVMGAVCLAATAFAAFEVRSLLRAKPVAVAGPGGARFADLAAPDPAWVAEEPGSGGEAVRSRRG